MQFTHEQKQQISKISKMNIEKRLDERNGNMGILILVLTILWLSFKLISK